jgi:hypothetical protein
MLTLPALLLLALPLSAAPETAPAKVPILYSTDLFHPHDDPDDHYDLASLFALDEFDIRGIVLDLGAKQKQKIGRPPVEQMMKITGRRVTYAIGLGEPLRSRDDKALEQARDFQAGVNLLLAALRESKEKVTIFSTGSCRDLAAAINREPALFREKVRAVYFNVGNGPNEKQDEWNVMLDAKAYLRVFESGVPLYWCPCFGKNGYATFFVADQTTVVKACKPRLQNFFIYCLTQSKADPLAFLDTAPAALPKGPRNMWCTAPLLHAAGRKIYQRAADDFVALGPGEAQEAGLAGKEIAPYEFVPVRVTIDAEKSSLVVEVRPAQPNAFVFRATHKDYGKILASCLKNLLAGCGTR